MNRLAVLLAVLAVGSCGHDDETPATRLLTRLALVDVVLEQVTPGQCYFSRYLWGRRFSARNARGQTVRGVVCWSGLKSTALKLDEE